MNPVRSIRNQYLGINAHLNSLLQAGGDWPNFHSNHIPDLMRLLRIPLLPMGYTAFVEQSLQIRRYGQARYSPQADILIYDTDPYSKLRPFQPPRLEGNAITYAAADLLEYAEDEVLYHKAVGIYEAPQSDEDKGDPVVWIELLSPSNKPGGQDSRYYRQKRRRVIESGIVFVEIDYLHEQPPTFEKLPVYLPGGSPSEQKIAAYQIAVIEPRPDIEQGYGHIYRFGVDEPLPVIDIPLNGDDVLKFDLGPVYDKTFAEVLYGAGIDYAQLPVHFESYNETDQARIVSRMLHVLDAAQAGRDLEQPPRPIEPLPLGEALKRLETYQRA